MQLHHSNWIRIIKPQANLGKPPKNSKEPHRLQRSPLLPKRHQPTKHYKIPYKEDKATYIHLAWILCEIVRIKRTQVAEVGRIQRAWTSESWETYQTRKAGISTQRRTCQKPSSSCLVATKLSSFVGPYHQNFQNKKLPYTQAAATAAESQIFHLGLRAAKTPSIIISSCFLEHSRSRVSRAFKKKKSCRGSFSCKTWLHDFFKHWVVQETTMQQQPQLPGFITTKKKHKSHTNQSKTHPHCLVNLGILWSLEESINPLLKHHPSSFLPGHCTFPAQLG